MTAGMQALPGGDVLQGGTQAVALPLGVRETLREGGVLFKPLAHASVMVPFQDAGLVAVA
jgi:hypothetical protein